MLELVKVALRVTSTAYDSELNQLIYAACADLGLTDIVAIQSPNTTDPLIRQAVITYCGLRIMTGSRRHTMSRKRSCR